MLLRDYDAYRTGYSVHREYVVNEETKRSGYMHEHDTVTVVHNFAME